MVSATDAEREAGQSDEGPKVIDLRFRLYTKNGDWYAQCLDLDLLTRRNDPRDALRAVVEQVSLYLVTAAESGEWDKYVPRRAPRLHWLSYYWAVIRHEIKHVLDSRLPRRDTLPTTYRMPFDQDGHLK